MLMPIPIPGDGIREETELETSLDCSRGVENGDRAGETEADESMEGDTDVCKGYGRPLRPLSIAILMVVL
jgi:hypothetical protein